ncbi:PAS domain-containing protein [uncultured Roseovarius sp.]|uniref:PAS domain-containing protein n=1 Tax=uncultured Roseovarius sp. TaxID=293344 RepID=UPI00262452C6|nr:PAS domain-containing protein [uncultured Roseovarius sp.]
MYDDGTITETTQQPGIALDGAEADLRAFRSHWASMRLGESVPRRSDIDPRRIGPLLSNAFIAERIAPGVTRLRIAGMHLNDLMGMEVRGMPLSSFIAPAARQRFADALVDLFDRPATLELDLCGKTGFGRPPLAGRLVLLPLRSDLGDVSRALGCLVTQGEIGRTMRRFDIGAIRMAPLTTTPQQMRLTSLTGGATSPGPGHRARRGHNHLRLVK